jgi:hypothetical protein
MDSNRSYNWFAFVICILLAACNGSMLSPSSANSTVGSSAHRLTPTAASWMNPDAKNQRLYYVSDLGTKNVYVFGASTFKLVGELGGFLMPMGECVDAAQNVWIVDYDSRDVVEYAHGGTTPLEKIRTGEGNPTSCAVDPATGNVAVSVHNYDSSPGWLQICASPSKCKRYTSSSVAYISYLSYDSAGKLYLDGGAATGDGSHGFAMAVYSGGKFRSFEIRGAELHAPSGIVNHDGVLSLRGPTLKRTTTIYQVSTNGMVTGATQLADAHGCDQFEIIGASATQSILCPSQRKGTITTYLYPAGGSPVQTVGAPFTKPHAIVYSE